MCCRSRGMQLPVQLRPQPTGPTGADRGRPWPWRVCARRPVQVGGASARLVCAARCCWSWLTLEVQLHPGSQQIRPTDRARAGGQACGARTAACADEARRGRAAASGAGAPASLRRCAQAPKRPIVARPCAWREGVKNNLLNQQKEASAPDPHDARRVSADTRAGPAPPPRCTLCTARGGLRAPDACAPTGPSTPCRR